MKLLPSIYLVGSGSTGIYLTNYLDCNVYLVDCKTEYVLIDSGAGYDIKPLLSEINRIVRSDKPLSSILLTHHHGDHAGGAALLKELYLAASMPLQQKLRLLFRLTSILWGLMWQEMPVFIRRIIISVPVRLML